MKGVLRVHPRDLVAWIHGRHISAHCPASYNQKADLSVICGCGLRMRLSYTF